MKSWASSFAKPAEARVPYVAGVRSMPVVWPRSARRTPRSTRLPGGGRFRGCSRLGWFAVEGEDRGTAPLGEHRFVG